MKKTLIFLFLFSINVCLFSIPSQLYAAGLDAGFKGNLWYSPAQPFENEPIRIYTAVYNQSSFDVVANLKLYQGAELFAQTPIFIAQNTTFHQWFDIPTPSGTPVFTAVLSESEKSELGKTLEPITLLNTTSSLLKITLKTKPVVTKTTSTTTPSNASTTFSTITVSSDQEAHTTQTTSSSSTADNFEIVPQNSFSFLKKISDTVQPSLSFLTTNLTEHLKDQKAKLDQELADDQNNQPLPILEESAKHLESKTSWLKIPRDKIPSFKQLESWSLGAALFILNTWWLMLLIVLLLLRALWKLWRFVRRGNEY